MKNIQGKRICKILKEVRQQIADANGIGYAPRECHYDGACDGTCPGCEQEVRYLENCLDQLRKNGTKIKVAGIAAGLLMAQSISAESYSKKNVEPQLPLTEEVVKSTEDSITIHGSVVDTKGEVYVGAAIRINDTKQGTISGMDGNFVLKVPNSDRTYLVITYLGAKTQKIKLKDIKDVNQVKVTLEEDEEVIESGTYMGIVHVDRNRKSSSIKQGKDKKSKKKK